MGSNQISQTPLEKIGLSCSGGGYRAASYHLGAMSYLNKISYNHKPLLENVKLISTVSGGTITGIVYALKKAEGKSFIGIYHFLLGKLQTLDLVKSGIEKLNPGAHWDNPGKHKNLINAFAEQYDLHFTSGATFSALDPMNSHLDAVVFNSTEFTNAVDFRFKNRGWLFTGNFYNRIKNEVAAEIKLADAMASSSCFPGGFEPMIWPDDFVHKDAPNLRKLKESTKEVMGIMDGGIYDNQGIDAMLSYKASEATPYFDLVIVSDVASPYMDPYKPYTEKEKKGWRALTLKEAYKKFAGYSKRVNTILIAIALIFFGLPLISGYDNNLWTGVSITLGTLALLIYLLKLYMQSQLDKVKQKISDYLSSLKDNFLVDNLSKLRVGELSVHRVEPLIMDRLNSLISLLMNVFLKVVRRLNYKILYNNNNYTYRRISNLIKQLTEEDFNTNQKRRKQQGFSERLQKNSVLIGEYGDIISKEISAIADEASGFGTTLWFTNDDKLNDMLEKLVVLGQVTMCYNLLWYLENLIYTDNIGFEALQPEVQKNILSTYDQCKNDWLEFNKEPDRLYKELAKMY
jgi:predicted acylesterase/phospholipase RssA